MKIGTLLTVYNRPEHTKKVLDSLANNYRRPELLYIYQDGPKNEEDRVKCEEVSKVVEAMDWCKVIYKKRKSNVGLAVSVEDAINTTLIDNDAVIVLEDDCQVHPLFMDYMIKSLEKYYESDNVYCINGYASKSDVTPNGSDTYFVGRISSWGWATWKNKWSIFNKDYMLVRRLEDNEESNRYLSIWGPDLKDTVIGNIDGRCDSWAVFWALKVIEKKGLCLTPFKSLVEYIGGDGTGTHSGFFEANDDLEKVDRKTQLTYPEKEEITEAIQNDFATFWSGRVSKVSNDIICTYQRNLLRNWLLLRQRGYSLGMYLKEKGYSKVSIWGAGKLCDLLINDIDDEIKVDSVILTEKQAEIYHGIRVIDIEELDSDIDVIIIIPEYDYDEIHQNIARCVNVPDITLGKVIEKVLEEKQVLWDEKSN